MANTLSYTSSGTYTGPTGDSQAIPGVTALAISVAGSNYVKDTMTVNNTDTTIPLGSVTGALGVGVFKNLDAAIAISIRVAAAGTKFLRVLAGECWTIRLDSGITAPVAIADSGTPLMAYEIHQT